LTALQAWLDHLVRLDRRVLKDWPVQMAFLDSQVLLELKESPDCRACQVIKVNRVYKVRKVFQVRKVPSDLQAFQANPALPDFKASTDFQEPQAHLVRLVQLVQLVRKGR